MKITNFLDTQRIAWSWCYLDQSNGKKDFVCEATHGYRYPDGFKSPKHFKDNPGLISRQRDYFLKHMESISGIAEQHGWLVRLMISTADIHQYDVDQEEYEIDFKKPMAQLPWYRSVGKKLPHIFFKPLRPLSSLSSQRTPYEFGDLLTGQIAYADPQTTMFNYDKPLDWDHDQFIADYPVATIAIATTRHQQPHENEKYPKQSKEQMNHILDMIDGGGEYDRWLAVGMALKSWDEEDGYVLWKEWSSRFPKYQEAEWAHANRIKWDSFTRQDGYNVGTLINLMHHHEEEEEDDDHVSEEERKMLETFTNNSCAVFFRNGRHKEEWKYCRKNKCWYGIHENNTWYCVDEPVLIIQQLQVEVERVLVYHMDRLTREAITKNIEDDRRDLLLRVKKYAGYLTTIGAYQFKKNCVSELKGLFSVEGFHKKLDDNPNLLAFTNGVYDFTLNAFRPIEPRDYISITVGYKHRESSVPIRAEIIDCIRSMFMTGDDANYLLNVIASALIGSNLFQEFYILSGSGGNGKSLIMSLLHGGFGGYWKDINTSSITKSKKGANEHSDWCKTRGCRILTMNEPSASDYIQVDLVKKITGNDPLTERDLHKSTITFKPQFTPFMLCNLIPNLSRLDGGIERRIKIIDFPFQFKSAEEFVAGHETIRLRDVSLQDKFKKIDYCREFILILIDRYKEIKYKTELTQPSSHARKTSEFFLENNPVSQFLDQYIEITGDHKRDVIHTVELLNKYNSECGQERLLRDKEFKKKILEYGGGHNQCKKVKDRVLSVYTGLRYKDIS